MNMRGYKFQGSVTLFFAMVCMVIASLLLVTLESARISTVKSCAALALNQGVDSVLASYYSPLFQDYYLFGCYKPESTEEKRKESLEKSLKNFMGYATYPMEGLENEGDSLFSLLPYSIRDVEVQSTTSLKDYEADSLYLQAAQAIEYLGLQYGIDTLLDSIGVLGDLSKASKVYKMQADVEEKLAKLDSNTLELMSLIDGIEIDCDKLKFTDQNMLQCKQYFVKQYVDLPVFMESVHINHNLVFQSLYEKYEDKHTIYRKSVDYMEELVSLHKKKTICETEKATIEEQIKILSEQVHETYQSMDDIMRRIRESEKELEVLNKEENPDSISIDELQKQIKSLYHLRDEYSSQYNAACEQQECMMGQCNQIEKELIDLNKKIKNMDFNFREELALVEGRINSSIVVLEEAIEKTQEAIKVQKDSQEIVKEYENSLEKELSNMNGDIKESLLEELELMKQSTGLAISKDNIYADYDRILSTLQYDYDLIVNQLHPLTESEYMMCNEDMEGVLERLERQQDLFCNYSIEGLEFDYSSLNIHQQEKNQVLDTISGLVGGSIFNVVVKEPEKVSNRKIELVGLPSTIDQVLHNQISLGDASYLNSLWKGSVLSDIFGEFADCIGQAKGVDEGAIDMINEGLFHTYIQYFFKDYTESDKELIQTTKYPSVLNYEKEYLCFHKENDKDNLTKMIETTFFLRLVLNFMKLSSNADCKMKASVIASALVAFTGVPFLLIITKMLILMVWAVAESLVEVTILLQGKKLALYETGKCHVPLEELVGLTKERIHKIANEYKEKQVLSLDYDGYLLCYLLFQSKRNRCYGVMDLIQENLNLRYEGGFVMNRCITDLQVSMTYEVPKRFAIGLFKQSSFVYQKTISMGY